MFEWRCKKFQRPVCVRSSAIEGPALLFDSNADDYDLEASELVCITKSIFANRRARVHVFRNIDHVFRDIDHVFRGQFAQLSIY